jgi:glycosyltransferase involved in cell wall biosynthesis
MAPPHGSTLVFFGLIRRSKGLDLLIRALPTIARDVPDVRLVVAGDPIEPAEPFQELARELGVAERIEWRLRFLTEDEVADVMEEAAVVALPYRKIESSGVLATALGYGRPAVVADVGSLGDTISEFGAGAVVPAENPGALANACATLLTDADALARAYRATQTASRTLSWDEAGRAHERVYEQVLELRRR